MNSCNWSEMIERFKSDHNGNIFDEEKRVFDWVMARITDCQKINWDYLTSRYASEQSDGKMFNIEWLVFYWISNQEEFNKSKPLIFPK